MRRQVIINMESRSVRRAAGSVCMSRNDLTDEEGSGDDGVSFEGPDSDFTGPLVDSVVDALRL